MTAPAISLYQTSFFTTVEICDVWPRASCAACAACAAQPASQPASASHPHRDATPQSRASSGGRWWPWPWPWPLRKAQAQGQRRSEIFNSVLLICPVLVPCGLPLMIDWLQLDRAYVGKGSFVVALAGTLARWSSCRWMGFSTRLVPSSVGLSHSAGDGYWWIWGRRGTGTEGSGWGRRWMGTDGSMEAGLSRV